MLIETSPFFDTLESNNMLTQKLMDCWIEILLKNVFHQQLFLMKIKQIKLNRTKLLLSSISGKNVNSWIFICSTDSDIQFKNNPSKFEKSTIKKLN